MALDRRIARNFGWRVVFAVTAVLLVAITVSAQAPAASAQAPAASAQAPADGPAMLLTATPVNVAQAGDKVKINILKWSTEEERKAVVASTVTPPSKDAGGGRGGEAAGGGPPVAGAPPAPPAPFDPFVSLASALDKAQTVGVLWTNENAGYSIKYAYHASMADGGERIVLVTNRRLASLSPTPQGAKGPDFTVIEMRLDSKGAGEAKASLNAKVVVDIEDRTIALGNYAAVPAILKNVRK